MDRSLVFLGLVSVVALGAWSVPEAQSFSRNPADTEVGFVQPGAPDLVHQAKVTAETTASTASRQAGAATTCGPWDVSDAGMEAILKEMIRRGWRPPSRATALADIQSPFGVQVTALDPEAPAARIPLPQPPESLPLPTLPVEALEPEAPALPVSPSQAQGASEPKPQFPN
jgi:hypothetical protein